MPRRRALLALLLAVTWCSAAWHVDLEGVGLLLHHEHHAHHAHDQHHEHHEHDVGHGASGTHDDHEEIFARDTAQDQIRVTAGAVLLVAILCAASGLIAMRRPTLAARGGPRRRRETDPPFAHTWQFVQRCAPESVAPPVFG